MAEHLMDEVEVEGISPATSDNAGNAVTEKPPLHFKNLGLDKKPDVEDVSPEKNENAVTENESVETKQRDAPKPSPATTCPETSTTPATTDVDMAAATNTPAKRAHEETLGASGTSGATTCSEPPTKAAQLRRTSFKPRPNVQVERRPETGPPP